MASTKSVLLPSLAFGVVLSLLGSTFVSASEDEGQKLIGLLDNPVAPPYGKTGPETTLTGPTNSTEESSRVRNLRKSLADETARFIDFKKQILEATVAKQQLTEAIDHYEELAFSDAEGRVREAELRRSKTEKLAKVRRNLPEVESIVANLTSENYLAQQQVEKVHSEYEELLNQYNDIATKLREHPVFEHWLNKRTQSYTPLFHQTLLKASRAANPILNGIKTVEQFNEHLSDAVSAEVDRLVPAIHSSAFYSGMLFYLILLFPLVVIMWLIQQIHKTLGKLTITHYIYLGNLYMSLLYLTVGLMSSYSGTDVLIVFRHRNQSGFELFLIFQMAVCCCHCGLQVAVCLREAHQKHMAEAGAVCLCGYHFFYHIFGPAMMNRDPAAGALIYYFYCMIFGLIGAEKGPLFQERITAPPSQLPTHSTDSEKDR